MAAQAERGESGMICELCNQRIVVSDADDNAIVIHMIAHVYEQLDELKKLFKVVAL